MPALSLRRRKFLVFNKVLYVGHAFFRSLNKAKTPKNFLNAQNPLLKKFFWAKKTMLVEGTDDEYNSINTTRTCKLHVR